MAQHARLGPSASERWLACPASVNLQAAFENKSSAAANEGTQAHEVVEKLLQAWMNGDVIEQTKAAVGVSEEMLSAAMVAWDYVVSLSQKYEDMGVNTVVYLEERVDPHYYTGRNDMFGTADIIVEAGEDLHVIDFKYGKGVYVPAYENPQLKIYGLGAMSPNAEENRGAHGFKRVFCTIIQPRNLGKENDAVRTHAYSVDELELWAADVLNPAAKATDDTNTIPVAGEEQCRWCLAKSTCPAASEKVLKLCSVFEPVQKVEDLSTLANSTADQLTVEQLASIVENAPFITGWLKAVNDRVRSMLENHEAVPGLKLVRGRRMNKWSLPDAEILEQLSKGKGHIPKKDLQQMKLLSAPNMLKNKSLKPAQKERMQAVIIKSEGTLSIAAESDERPNAITPIVFEEQHSFL